MINEPKDLLANAERDIQLLESRQNDVGTDEVIQSLKATVRELSDSIGECQRAVPYSSMRPILGPDGTMKWCCNHDPEHCS